MLRQGFQAIEHHFLEHTPRQFLELWADQANQFRPAVDRIHVHFFGKVIKQEFGQRLRLIQQG